MKTVEDSMESSEMINTALIPFSRHVKLMQTFSPKIGSLC